MMVTPTIPKLSLSPLTHLKNNPPPPPFNPYSSPHSPFPTSPKISTAEIVNATRLLKTERNRL